MNRQILNSLFGRLSRYDENPSGSELYNNYDSVRSLCADALDELSDAVDEIESLQGKVDELQEQIDDRADAEEA